MRSFSKLTERGKLFCKNICKKRFARKQFCEDKDEFDNSLSNTMNFWHGICLIFLGFLLTLFGMVSINSLTVISIYRWIIVHFEVILTLRSTACILDYRHQQKIYVVQPIRNIDISHYRLFFRFFLLYTDRVPFELFDSAAYEGRAAVERGWELVFLNLTTII
jgi:hypothetical protein